MFRKYKKLGRRKELNLASSTAHDVSMKKHTPLVYLIKSGQDISVCLQRKAKIIAIKHDHQKENNQNLKINAFIKKSVLFFTIFLAILAYVF